MVTPRERILSLFLAGTLSLGSTLPAFAQTTSPVGDLGNGASLLPTGQVITPTAAPGSTVVPLATGLRPDTNADAAEAVKTTLSPDGKTLLVLTSGSNQDFQDATTGALLTYTYLDPTTGLASTVSTSQAEWVFVFDVTTGALVKKQQINIPNTYNGLVWSPDGTRFYVSAGIDDRVLVYKNVGGQFVPDAPFILLGHNSNQTAPQPDYDGGLLKGTPAALAGTGAVAAGLDISKDGQTLVVANFENDSISVVSTATRQVTREIKFFTPGGTVATGEYPFDVAVLSNAGSGQALKVYVTSQRDDEVLSVDLTNNTVKRIPVGSQPNKLLLSANGSHLYIANGNSDTITDIETATDNVVRNISLARPGYKYKGSTPNSLAFSPDGRSLYVTLANENAIAVVNLRSGKVLGRIPTGWLPNSLSVSQDGKTLYVVNAKANSGPNPAESRTTTAGENTNIPVSAGGTCTANCYKNPYNWALEKAAIATIPVPSLQTLRTLSQQVDQNDGFNNAKIDPVMAYLRTRIKHVIYVVKENRTYDQVLGDLPVGNGDPSLALFPNAISPNHHKLASDFVTLDNFYSSGESSGVGWSWSTFARTTDYTEKTQSVLYGNANFRGLTYDYEATTRNLNIGLPQTSPTPSPFTTRLTGIFDPTGNSSILPGNKDVNGPEGDGDLAQDAVGGYLWDSALRAGKTVRNYGFFIDLAYYGTSIADPTQSDPNNPLYIPISATPYPSKPQSATGKTTLADKTDVYFRGYDNKGPDIYRFNEWLREFQLQVTNNNLPNLSLMRIMHDHFGNFSNAVAGLNTASLQMSDNDYALGRLVETISKSIYWRDTAIVVIEDDSQDGPDHVDSHRSLAYIISAYTKRGAVVSTNYNQTNILRTVEDLLGIDHVGIFDANALPMSDVFTLKPNFNTYTAIVPGGLCVAPVAPTLVPACTNPSVPQTAALPDLHKGDWWANMTKDYDFSVEDRLDAAAFNQLLWAGIKGADVPYPVARSRKDLRKNRAQLLKATQVSVK